MLTGDKLLEKVQELAKVQKLQEHTITEPTKPYVSQEQSIGRMNRETTITKQQLDKLWNALEYTRATISPSGNFDSKKILVGLKSIKVGHINQKVF